MTDIVSYNHNLGDGLSLNAYSIVPGVTQDKLREEVHSQILDHRPNLESLARGIEVVTHLDSFADLKVEASADIYKVPGALQAYRDAIEEAAKKKGNFNGPVAIVQGAVENPLTLCRGGYFDFMTTKLEAIPSTISNKYAEGKTVKEVMQKNGISNNGRARFLGFTYFMKSKDGMFNLVQRGKNLGIAADCISTCGSTPGFDEEFFKKDFSFQKYYENHVSEEMKEEFKLKESEFDIRGLYLMEDRETIPFAVINITTPLSTKDLAQRVYGHEDAVREHPILYSMKPESIHKMIEGFNMFPSIAVTLDLLKKNI